MNKSCLSFDKKYKCVSFLMFGLSLLYYVIRAELHCEKCISKPFFRTNLHDFSSHLTHVRKNMVQRKDKDFRANEPRNLSIVVFVENKIQD